MKFHNAFRAVLLGAAVSALSLPAVAQSAGGYGAAGYPSSQEEIIVTGPRLHQPRDEYGEAERNVALSRSVRVDDLDLRTGRGAHVLRQRVKETARTLCRQLDAQFLTDNSRGDHCYRDALDNAMFRANRAIDDARYND